MYASKLLTERSPVVDRVNKLLKGWGVSPALPARTRYVLIEIDDVSPNKLASIEEVETALRAPQTGRRVPIRFGRSA